MRAEWTLNAAGALTNVTAPSVAISGRVTHSPAARASATTLEVRHPTGLNLLARDARA
jgi:hypothetical protein